MRVAVLFLIALLASVSPAQAGPIAAVVASIIGGIKAFAAASVFGGWLVRTVLSIGLSVLAKSLRDKPRASGITTSVTTTGGSTPQKFILGRYATAGQLIAPPMSYGSEGSTPRAYLVYVIALSVVPGATLARLIINDQYVEPGAQGTSWGRPVTGNLADHAWLDYRNGTQTACHPDLLEALGADPDRPWLSDMVGPGLCYAVCRFRYSREHFNGLPSVRFEMIGGPLYDPRADGSVGGSGAQRWADRSTWTQTSNVMVIIYNILRGIDVGGGLIWGGDAQARDLPLATWFAAMNECDVAIPLPGGGTEPQYRCGLEVALDDEPATVIEELLKVCSGQIVEVGGVWKVRCGPPALPVYLFTDADVLVSREQEFDPFPGLASTWNGITATYPEPDSLWEQVEAPPRYNTDWEAEDGDRRLLADLQLPASPYGLQNQRIMASYIADERRHRRHRHALPPEASILEPLDTVSWTSARNGYTAKIFEVTGVAEQVMSLIPTVQLRERDAGDYAWVPSDALAAAPSLWGVTPPVAQVLPGFSVQADVITDAGSVGRRVAIRINWNAAEAEDAIGVLWEVRFAGSSVVSLTGSHGSIATGFVRIVEGVLPDADYQVRATLIVDRATEWTAWADVTIPDVRIGSIDIDGRGLSVLDIDGEVVFGSSGEIGAGAYITVNGSNIAISAVAANSLVPVINYVGEFATAPTQGSLGAGWAQNSVYRNSTDGKSYILTGTPLAWAVYFETGVNFAVTLSSSNGTTFRVAQARSTMISARLFKNGADVTDVTPNSWFRWRRVSIIPRAPPNDDATFNTAYGAGGYKQIDVTVDTVHAVGTFFCDVISP
jgi:hypothetical protein